MSKHAKKPNPDERQDNMKKIQKNLNNTLDNMQEAELSMETASDFQEEEIKKKNARRREAIDGMRHELRDEHKHQKRQSK
ncbi:small acid-soluble spore protein (thioredoxin-like protein) [Alkalibacillus flavidus]|uniref:Small, acid-soluble spore protein Tlp n=1 Tax=Alkalibacillus flavidus TaxID=546021 RepID=A0ABV2KRN7_9BACI